jgi:YggT family protein
MCSWRESCSIWSRCSPAIGGPPGFLLVLAEIVYTLTDPPLKLLRKIIPPLRLGQVSLDLGFIVLLIGIQIIASVFFNLSHTTA